MQLQLREHGQPGLCHTRHTCRARKRSKPLERLPLGKLAPLRTQAETHASPTPLPLGTLRDGGQARQVGGHIGRCGETGGEAAKEDPERLTIDSRCSRRWKGGQSSRCQRSVLGPQQRPWRRETHLHFCAAQRFSRGGKGGRECWRCRVPGRSPPPWSRVNRHVIPCSSCQCPHHARLEKTLHGSLHVNCAVCVCNLKTR